jgi:hypothetical protein
VSKQNNSGEAGRTERRKRRAVDLLENIGGDARRCDETVPVVGQHLGQTRFRGALGYRHRA